MMKIKIPAIVIAIVVFVFPIQPIRGQAIQTGKLASWTIQKVIKDAEENKKLKSRLRYKESFIEEEYDTNGRLRSRKEETKIVDGSRKFQVIGFELNLYEILTKVYDFKLANTADSVGLAVIDDKIYVAIDFAPKTGLGYKTLEDRFTHRIHGRIFVDVSGEHYYIKKIEARIPEEFSFIYWGRFLPIPIKIKNFELTMIQDRLNPGGVIVEKSIEVKVIFNSLRSGSRNYNYTYGNFENKK